MYVMSKIFSCVINVCCFDILDAHGTKFQCGGMPKIGCRDGLFTIKNILNMQRNHKLPNFVAFSDLVKYFDTSGHGLLIKLLGRYGYPPNFYLDIHRMYQDLIVVLKIGKSIEDIVQEVGVRQGDNTTPILFLLLMDDLYEILEKIWEDKVLEKV